MSWFKYIKSLVFRDKYSVIIFILGVFLAALFILPKFGYLQSNDSSSLSSLSLSQRDIIGDTGVSPGVSPTLTPKVSLSPLVSSRVSPVSPLVTPTSANKNSQSQSNNYNTSVFPSPTPTIRVSPSVTPSVSPSVSPRVSPTLTPEVTVSPSMTPNNNTNNGLTVVINEIAWMGTLAEATDEWIELYNNSDQPVNLEGWAINSEDSKGPNIALKESIQPYSFFLIERTDNHTTDVEEDLTSSFGNGLSNDKCEKLVLIDSGQNTRDSVGCNGNKWFGGNISTKSSMERINPYESGDKASNWATNNGQTRNGKDVDNNQINGTPKAENSVYSVYSI